VVVAMTTTNDSVRSPVERALREASYRGEPYDVRIGDETRDDPAGGGEWGTEREIDAEFLRDLCAGAEHVGKVHPTGVRVAGARIVGILSFEATRLQVPLVLEGCTLPDGIVLERAEVTSLSLAGCRTNAVRAENMRASAGLDLTGLHASRGVTLRGASIGGRLVCDGATFGEAHQQLIAAAGLDAPGLRTGHDVSLRRVHAVGINLELAQISGDLALAEVSLVAPADAAASGGRALAARGCSVTGNLLLNRVDAHGEISLVGAEVRGSLRCTGGFLRAGEADDAAPEERGRGRPALDAQGIDVRGHIAFRDDFVVDGGVNLLGAHLGLGLECTNGSVSNPGLVALNLQGLRAGGNVLLRGDLTVRGELVLLGAEVGGTLDLDDAEFSNEEGISIRADTIRVAGNALLHAGCRAQGEVSLAGADIGGDLDCRGASFDNPDGTAFTIEGAHVERTFYWGPFREKGSTTTDNLLFFDIAPPDWSEDQPRGVIDFSRARVSRLVDHWTTWAYDPDLKLDGFVFDDVGDDATTPELRLTWLRDRARRRRRTRIDWKKLGFEYELPELPDTGEYSPQPFEQLAAVYERTGNTEAARRVRIEKERSLRLSGRLKRTWAFSNLVLDRTIRYGWEPWRAIVWGVVLIAVGALVFASAGKASFTRDPGKFGAPPFQPVAYSVDTFLPIIDLGQQATWAPRDTATWQPFGWRTSGLVLHVFIWCDLMVGWVVSTLGVVAFTGLVRKS
jgi:hypothetical protein